MVPGMRVAAPRDPGTLREELREAVSIQDGPSALRFSKGTVGPDVPAVERIGKVDVLRRPDEACTPDVLLVTVGARQTSCWSRWARSRSWASKSPDGWRTRASA
jgi:1-deoxy-D-xylulose-5-phosphate synthase